MAIKSYLHLNMSNIQKYKNNNMQQNIALYNMTKKTWTQPNVWLLQMECVISSGVSEMFETIDWGFTSLASRR